MTFVALDAKDEFIVNMERDLDVIPMDVIISYSCSVMIFCQNIRQLVWRRHFPCSCSALTTEH